MWKWNPSRSLVPRTQRNSEQSVSGSLPASKYSSCSRESLRQSSKMCTLRHFTASLASGRRKRLLRLAVKEPAAHLMDYVQPRDQFWRNRYHPADPQRQPCLSGRAGCKTSSEIKGVKTLRKPIGILRCQQIPQQKNNLMQLGSPRCSERAHRRHRLRK